MAGMEVGGDIVLDDPEEAILADLPEGDAEGVNGLCAWREPTVTSLRLKSRPGSPLRSWRQTGLRL